MKVILVHNPKAGDRAHGNGEGLVKLIERAGHEVAYTSVKEKGWEQALDDPADLVAAAGGDGTVGKVARAMIGRATPFTVLPAGTANNIGTALGVAKVHHADLVAGWGAGEQRRLDVGVATGAWGARPFIEGFGLGLFAETMARIDSADSPERKQLDAEVSVWSILRERLKKQAPLTLKVVLDGRDLSGEYALLEAMNICYVGPNLHLAPKADPGDGFLDLVLLPESNRRRMDEYLAGGGNAPPPKLTVYRGKALRIEWDQADVHLDDEPLPREPGWADVTLDPRGVQFLTPAH
jgi:diacylglycerol kinase family enzyme